MGRKAQKNDSLPGSLDMLILRTLSRRDLHGYGIVQFIQQSSDGVFFLEAKRSDIASRDGAPQSRSASSSEP